MTKALIKLSLQISFDLYITYYNYYSIIMESSKLPPISDLEKYLNLTIEFLKGEINIKNEMMKKLLNRFEQYDVRNQSQVM